MARIKKNIKLIKIATRDRSLLNGYVWHKNKRLCYKTWLNYTLKNDAIIRPANGKMSIWFDPSELKKIHALTRQKINKDPSFVKKIIQKIHTTWQVLQPFASKDRPLTTPAEFQNFFHSYIQWWSHASMLMIIPDIPGIASAIKKRVLDVRSQYEKYSDISDKLLLLYIKKHFSKYKNFSDVISPEEIFSAEKLEFTAKKLGAIKKRKQQGWVLINGELASYEDAPKLLSKFRLELTSENSDISKDSLSGTAAYKGKVLGIARLVTNKNELDKVLNGDILVSDATSPDYLPAMKKAAAFVTDEGGMTCHAAIVAREMNKPCIVGTKIATQFIEDGMKIEVDANKGTITIIKE
ncbi:MAG: PEP-utilizing enzyme [Patescibacteria group bacterium]|nr:PEP-utilizing enzyme [Patescibacteria group bacterium]MDD5294313.1 PEP-utilizing enzyme [Patescibacteria group bacterium]MDD5554136.1 PEP-utilizing enzyme [Patescibacteria group bacterium]